MAGRPKKMVENLTTLETELVGLLTKLRQLMPDQYFKPMNGEGEAGEIWRDSLLALSNAGPSLSAVRHFYCQRAGMDYFDTSDGPYWAWYERTYPPPKLAIKERQDPGIEKQNAEQGPQGGQAAGRGAGTG